MSPISKLNLCNQNTHEYGLTITAAIDAHGTKVLFCDDCEGIIIDSSTNVVELEVSLELHVVEHKWFEFYPPISPKGVKETLWRFYEALTPELQKHEEKRKARTANGPFTIDAVRGKSNEVI